MPELPEVQTTVDGLNRTVKGKVIESVWTGYKSSYHAGRDNIKNPKFFKKFERHVVGKKILKAERRAKNILIHLSDGLTIVAHMKMTGYFFYNPPQDAKYIHLIFTFGDGTKLGFSDMRKFAKVTLVETNKLEDSPHLSHLGPEPLDKNFQFSNFKLQLLKKPKGKIKQVLMDQTVIAGIGNIYSDEILWRAGVHPLSIVSKIPKANLQKMFKATKETLKKGIDMGGDSMSDYRNIKGEKGDFQDYHRAYRKTGQPCSKKGCAGVLQKTSINNRSAHFCPVHQKLFK